MNPVSMIIPVLPEHQIRKIERRFGTDKPVNILRAFREIGVFTNSLFPRPR